MTVATLLGRTHVKHGSTPVSIPGGCTGKAKVLQLDSSRSIRKGKVINTLYFAAMFEDYTAKAKYDGNDMQSVIRNLRAQLKEAMQLPEDQVIDFDKPAIDTIWKQYQKSAINA